MDDIEVIFILIDKAVNIHKNYIRVFIINGRIYIVYGNNEKLISTFTKFLS
ncbi:MAG: hypothetical protein ACTTNT_01950 [Arsenophonus sp.]